jgi:general secretion pathway protein L
MGTNVVSRFYSWWLHELAKTLTPRRTSAQSWRTLLRYSPEGLEISTRSAGSIKHLGTLKPDAAPAQTTALKRLVAQKAGPKTGQVLLRLSPADVVERTIQIPEAASDVIEPVLQNQMERIVPWSQDDTRYGYRVVGPNSTSPDQLDVHVVATTRSILDAALKRARNVGLTPFAIDFAPASDGASSIELMSLAPDPVKKTERALNGFFALLLAFGAIVSAFGLYQMWSQQAQNDDLMVNIASAKTRLEEVKRLNDENALLRQQRERLVRRKMEEPAVMVLIEALSRALPDSAYLTELEIHGRDTRIVGKSDDPTALITVLEATPQFQDVHFSAATTREEGETAGTFSIISRAQGGPDLEGQP